MHPNPVKQPNLTQKFPVTNMPTGLVPAPTADAHPAGGMSVRPGSPDE